MSAKFVRTFDSAFANLPGYDFRPNYSDVEGLRLHYVDEGPRNGPIAMLMHGMPTWSYLNRHIIKALVGRGYRCIAADHIGFGRSDKVTEDSWYSIARHTAAHRKLIEALDLRGITVFCQDWGGPIGLAQAAEMPDRFERLVIMNTWLHHPGYAYTPELRRWNAAWQPDGIYGLNVPEKISLGMIMLAALGHITPADMMRQANGGDALTLSDGQKALLHAYDAPFIGLGHDGHAGPRRFPLSLPFDNPKGGNAATQARHFEMLKAWKKPVHFIWGGTDRIFTTEWGRQWASQYPQATFDLLPDAGHFLQESHGANIAELFLSRAAK